VEESPVSPFSLILVEKGRCRIVYFDERGLRWDERDSGIHVITHGDVNQASDGRVSYALEVTSSWNAGTTGDSEQMTDALAGLLRSHDGGRAVCLHSELFGTVSSMLLSLDLSSGESLWRFADGPPCTTDYEEVDPDSLAGDP
jgi:hypothetical protein